MVCEDGSASRLDTVQRLACGRMDSIISQSSYCRIALLILHRRETEDQEPCVVHSFGGSKMIAWNFLGIRTLPDRSTVSKIIFSWVQADFKVQARHKGSLVH